MKYRPTREEAIEDRNVLVLDRDLSPSLPEMSLPADAYFIHNEDGEILRAHTFEDRKTPYNEGRIQFIKCPISHNPIPAYHSVDPSTSEVAKQLISNAITRFNQRISTRQ